VRAEIVNRLGQPVRAANVPAYLGLASCARPGAQHGQAVINQAPIGLTRVEALTNAAGVAIFGIRSPVARQSPRLVRGLSGHWPNVTWLIGTAIRRCSR
jgi:hypothetical protein